MDSSGEEEKNLTNGDGTEIDPSLAGDAGAKKGTNGAAGVGNGAGGSSSGDDDEDSDDSILKAVVKEEPKPPRRIGVNTQNIDFGNNKISTGRYSLLTFIPRCLGEQFLRLANDYFLLVAILQQIPGVSPTGRFTTIGPLTLVIAATMIKEAIEDWKRHRSDDATNNQPATVWRDGAWTEVKWQNIYAGEVIKVLNREYFPADLVLLSSSEPMGVCYIETASLDGETNLKIRQALEHTAETITTDEQVASFSGECEHEQPNPHLYNFEGSLYIGDSQFPLSNDQILLRGAVLRNTPWAIGLAIFTGHDTKLMQNAKQAPTKRTSVEKLTNYQIVSIFCFQMVLCAVCALSSAFWTASHQKNHIYLGLEGVDARVQGLQDFLTFFILFNNLIPISLYVSMELVKVGQAFLVNSDVHMYYAVNDTPALARTSNLNEELGQIHYIFSDKTGTLTCNIMEFRKCTIGGVRYGDNCITSSKAVKLFNFEDEAFDADLEEGGEQANKIKAFLQLLAVCHTVIPEVDPDDESQIIYQAASPDEGALVTAAKVLGFNFHSRSPREIVVEECGADAHYELLNVCEFNSTRKRMSTIYRCPDGRIVLFCKGADSVIMERLAPAAPGTEAAALIEETNSHLEDFAADGLRTLCLAAVELEPAAYEEWNKTFVAASNSIGDRDDRLADAAEAIEKNLILLGATAIEDKLQDGVPETIYTLGQAGIKIWVLTGDKQETAINIGYSCRLLNNHQHRFVVNETSPAATLATLKSCIAEAKEMRDPNTGEGTELALVADGATLIFALKGKVKLKFLELASMCKAVICCRVSPAQKADIVLLVKENVTHPERPLTLAIGDGANDVSMIQQAHVGVGISGEEGLQAARAADYSIAQFRYLERLLLVHGNWSYRRISYLILYSFYKNIALYLVQFWFTVNNGFSGQSIFERWAIGSYNVFFTSLPVLVVGLLDQDLSARALLENPQLYKPGQKKKFFNLKLFWVWVFNAIWHSMLAFYLTTFAFSHNVIRANGLSTGLTVLGAAIYTVVVIVVNGKLALDTSYWTVINVLAIVVMIANWFMYLLVYCRLNTFSPEFFGVDKQVLTSAVFWLTIVLVPFIALLRDIVWAYVKRTFFPEPYQIVQEMKPESMDRVRDAAKAVQLLAANDNPKWKGYGYDAAPNNHHSTITSYTHTGRNAGVTRQSMGPADAAGVGAARDSGTAPVAAPSKRDSVAPIEPPTSNSGESPLVESNQL